MQLDINTQPKRMPVNGDGVNSLAEKCTAGIVEHRQHPRFVVPWRIVMVYKKMGKHETYRGGLCDLSLGGASFFSDLNIQSADPVVVTIEVPSYLRGQKDSIVGVRCQVIHSVLSIKYAKFCIGIKFLDFNGNGKAVLTEALSGRVARPYLEKIGSA